jgi:hypothetical protein
VEQLMFIEQNSRYMPTVQAVIDRYSVKYGKGKAAAV